MADQDVRVVAPAANARAVTTDTTTACLHAGLPTQRSTRAGPIVWEPSTPPRSSPRVGSALRATAATSLMDVDLDIREREIVTLIGPNGAGKTTLVRVLLGLEQPDRGEVQRRKGSRIGYVPQRFDVDAVIPMTVERFLSLAAKLPSERHRRDPR